MNILYCRKCRVIKYVRNSFVKVKLWFLRLGCRMNYMVLILELERLGFLKSFSKRNGS